MPPSSQWDPASFALLLVVKTGQPFNMLHFPVSLLLIECEWPVSSHLKWTFWGPACVKHRNPFENLTGETQMVSTCNNKSVYVIQLLYLFTNIVKVTVSVSLCTEKLENNETWRRFSNISGALDSMCSVVSRLLMGLFCLLVYFINTWQSPRVKIVSIYKSHWKRKSYNSNLRSGNFQLIVIQFSVLIVVKMFAPSWSLILLHVKILLCFRTSNQFKY